MIIAKGRFKIELFNITIHIYICDNENSVKEEVNKLLKKNKDDLINYNCYGFVYSPDQHLNVNYLFLSAKDLSMNTITHETDHVRTNIIDFCSIPETDTTRETSANLSGYINEKVFKFLERKNIKYKI